MAALLVPIASIADGIRKSSYNPTAAVNYAYKWARSRNPSYPDITDNDCTNFASQVLQAGGWKNTIGKNAKATADWYAAGTREYNVSFTWRAVNGLRGRLIQGYEKTATSVSLSQLKVGDLIFANFDGGNLYDHTAVIVGFKSGDPILAYHSNDVYGIKFYDFKQNMVRKGYPLAKMKFTYMHINPA